MITPVYEQDNLWLYKGDNCEIIKDIPDNCIDLTVTSPPYDNLREYTNELEWNFEKFKVLAKELFRVTSDGGVVVWNVSDQTKNGSESGSSFRQALYFMDECNFKLHDTMLYMKENYIPLTHNRYEQCFEYMFVFVKGKLKTFNPIMVECKDAGKTFKGRTFYQRPESDKPTESNGNSEVNKFKQSPNAFYMQTKPTVKGHPAAFNDKLPEINIISWSNENDIVFDPFNGSGTTGKMCKILKRKYVGIEIAQEYIDISIKRFNDCNKPAQEWK